MWILSKYGGGGGSLETQTNVHWELFGAPKSSKYEFMKCSVFFAKLLNFLGLPILKKPLTLQESTKFSFFNLSSSRVCLSLWSVNFMSQSFSTLLSRAKIDQERDW